MPMLIADDNARMRATIRALLSLEAGDALECGTGLEAVELYDRCRPDWVFMDISMPALDGISATARIRAIDSTARVVIVTDYADDALREAAARAGATAFVTKDDLSRLLDVLASNR